MMTDPCFSVISYVVIIRLLHYSYDSIKHEIIFMATQLNIFEVLSKCQKGSLAGQ